MGSIGANTIFIATAFLFAWLIIVRKDSMSAALRRPMAMLALGLVAIAFVLIIVSLYQLT
jgi:hypothetical protein